MGHLSAREYRELLGLPPLGEEDALPPIDRALTLQHLLVCPRCRRSLTAVLLDLNPPPPFSAPPAPAGEVGVGLVLPDASDLDTLESPAFRPKVAEQILVRAIERLKMLEAERIRHPDALHETEALLTIPPDLRLEAVESKPRFRTPGVVDRLLELARKARDPHEIRHLAGLAGSALGFQSETSGLQLRKQALTNCLLGEVEIQFGHLELADDMLRNAALALRDEPLILLERVVLCRVAAKLRQEQGQTDEALGLLEHAATVAEDLGELTELALIRLSYGWLLFDELETERALLPLREALSLSSDEDSNPYTAFSALHALAMALAELQDQQSLEAVYRELDALARQLPDPLDIIRSRWVHAKAEARRYEIDSALAELRDVFASLLALGPGHEAARAGLELARMIAENTQDDDLAAADELGQIAGQVLALSLEKLPAHLRPALAFAFELVRTRRGFYIDALLSAEHYLERAILNPGYSYHPTPEPEQAMAWSDLRDSQRRKAARRARVKLTADGCPPTHQDLRHIAWIHEAMTGVRIVIPEGPEDPEEGAWS